MDLKVSYPVRNPPQPPALSAPQWALLIGARCHAQGCGDNEAEAHAALVTEATELYVALGIWLGSQGIISPACTHCAELRNALKVVTRRDLIDVLQVSLVVGDDGKMRAVIIGEGETVGEYSVDALRLMADAMGGVSTRIANTVAESRKLERRSIVEWLIGEGLSDVAARVSAQGGE
jgi:hypothetical protein